MFILHFEITSPGFPPNIPCDYMLVATAGKRVQLTVFSCYFWIYLLFHNFRRSNSSSPMNAAIALFFTMGRLQARLVCSQCEYFSNYSSMETFSMDSILWSCYSVLYNFFLTDFWRFETEWWRSVNEIDFSRNGADLSESDKIITTVSSNVMLASWQPNGAMNIRGFKVRLFLFCVIYVLINIRFRCLSRVSIRQRRNNEIIQLLKFDH